MALPSLNENVEVVKASVEAADPALTREELVQLGLSEKASANRKTLLKYLREKAKLLPVEGGSVEDPVDAPGEPPPGYVPTPEVEQPPGYATNAPVSADDPVTVPPIPGTEEAVFTAPKPLMQEVDPRPCIFRFQDVDINLFPVCGIHNSGMCSPCLGEDPPVKRCRVVCFAESNKHRDIKQAQVVLKSRAVVDNPATVEMVDVSEFDE
ncbi:MAG: hypothetical protein CEE38_23570 [Planctomycetes bacterium B3_Pla]|nr:MAG: hypothetical protein CEE38_23570 [Planctomycetes bacterium B3_Pla]